MKGPEDISPWNIIEHTDAKEILQQQSLSIPCETYSLQIEEPQNNKKQNEISPQDKNTSTHFSLTRESFKIYRSSSVGEHHTGQHVNVKDQLPSKEELSYKLKPRFSLQPLRHFQKSTITSKQSWPISQNRSTPFIKQRAQAIIKIYESGNLCPKYRNAGFEQSQKIKLQKIQAKTHKIEFTYSSPSKLKAVLRLQKLKMEPKGHILDTLLSRWD